MTTFIVSDSTSFKMPEWWFKFSVSVWEEPDVHETGFYSVRRRCLQAYGGSVRTTDGVIPERLLITFDKESDATWFLLRL